MVHGRNLTLSGEMPCFLGCLPALTRRAIGDATVVVKPKRLASAGKAGSRGAQLSTAVAGTGRCTRTGPEMGAPKGLSVVERVRGCGDADVVRV